jgi:mono/diheme cytochrome c family protein
MLVRRWAAIAYVLAVAGCASAAVATTKTDVRRPLGAYLTPDAPNGVGIPLRFDSSPGARVIRSTAGNLPAATYSALQAEHGATVYARRCASCHQRSRFVGQEFVESWNDRRLYDFYALVSSTMPLNTPGSLKEYEYLAVLAYLLKENHAVAGPDSLVPDTTALRGRKIAVRLP